MKNIAVLGSTGSIGTQTLEVAKKCEFNITALSVHSNIKLLEQQARQFLPRLVCVYNEDLYEELKQNLFDTSVNVVAGIDGLCQTASLAETDVVVNSVVGMVGLKPTLAAISEGKDIALANKETLVTGGSVVMRMARKKNVKIFPVDSEHSAIFQCIDAGRQQDVKKIILTASGGPFFGKTKKELSSVTIKDALNHPNWSMGAKITVDSATLMNKGLELIEAVWLFDIAPKDIEIVVHRESVIHSAVEFADNSVIAQLGVPNMKIPIQYALTYPERLPCDVDRLSLIDYGKLTFSEPDEQTFLCLSTAKKAIEKGGLCPTLINGANEKAVELFLQDKISFLDIGTIVSEAMELTPPQGNDEVENIIKADLLARQYVSEKAKRS